MGARYVQKTRILFTFSTNLSAATTDSAQWLRYSFIHGTDTHFSAHFDIYTSLDDGWARQLEFTSADYDPDCRLSDDCPQYDTFPNFWVSFLVPFSNGELHQTNYSLMLSETLDTSISSLDGSQVDAGYTFVTNPHCQGETTLNCTALDLYSISLFYTAIPGNDFICITQEPQGACYDGGKFGDWVGSVIPVPAAFWLFGTALIGLVGFGKRRKAA
jgi:hypothetical protein